MIGLGVSVATLLVAVLVLELVFRTFFPQPLYATALAPWGFWHQANASFIHGSDPSVEGNLVRGTLFLTHISYNSMGVRGPEYAIPKPPGVKRVVIIGDSFGDAMEVEFEDTMGQVLRRLLDTRRTELPIATSRPSSAPTAPDPAGDRLSILLWRALQAEASRSNAPLLVASLRISADGQTPRARFFDSLGIGWTSVDFAADGRIPLDGHWNAKGNADAAARVFEKIRSSALLSIAPSDRIEVVNLSHAAFDTCQYVQVFQALGAQFAADLILAVDSGIDSGSPTADLCGVSAAGTLVLSSRQFSATDAFVRNTRSLLRANSHFLTWIVDTWERSRSGRGTDRVPVPVP